MDTNTLGALVWQLSTRWRSAVDRAVAPMGLTQAQYTALSTLAAMRTRGESPSQRALAEQMGISPIFASKLLRALEAQGLIRRADHPQDARAFSLTLSRTGQTQLALAQEAVRALEETLTAPVGDPGGNAAQALRIMLKALLATPISEAAHPEAAAARFAHRPTDSTANAPSPFTAR
ncbi:MarR family winged helix-turn-helix transcriptional regulator [Pararhodobacter zhoushanensis]|uniref:MarR family winged helix-turn-helix transcriptional regulator n=1 Tax=Pararhodobacter zhoushanensis TaxID=2479545 RepID=UPI0013E0BAB3|nr:MarR family transcriptional regulator [Pararhodobacter zhoushanensis]